MNIENNKNSELAKHQRWDELIAEINSTADEYGRGKLIDEEIREAVVGVRALGLETSQSCSGHFNEDDGYRMPYLQFEFGEPEGEESEVEKEERVTKNESQREAVQKLVDEFNGSSEKLRIQDQGMQGAFRLVPNEFDNDKRYVQDDVEEIKSSQQTMIEFGKFLKDKYFNN